MTDRDILLKEFDADLDLYKFYMDIAVKITIWVIAITGAILSFYFTNANNENSLIKYSLYFPLFINVSFFIFCIRSIYLVEGLATDHLRVSQSLGIEVPLRLRALPNILLLFTLVYLIISVGIGCAIFFL